MPTTAMDDTCVSSDKNSYARSAGQSYGAEARCGQNTEVFLALILRLMIGFQRAGCRVPSRVVVLNGISLQYYDTTRPHAGLLSRASRGSVWAGFPQCDDILVRSARTPRQSLNAGSL